VTVLKNVSLIKPTSKLKEQYLSFYQEWKESNEELIPWVISKDPEDFEGMIERRKGYATQLLTLALEKTLELGINKVLVVCAATNIASKKTIVNNGGVQDKDFNVEDGKTIYRFWIEV
jgi:predicted acetyltransferase